MSTPPAPLVPLAYVNEIEADEPLVIDTRRGSIEDSSGCCHNRTRWGCGSRASRRRMCYTNTQHRLVPDPY